MRNCIPENIRVVLQEIEKEHECKIYAVGGCVRDLFLEKESKDLDFVTVGGDAVEIFTALGRRFNTKITTSFDRFGVAQIIIGDLILEIIEARKEVYQENSRKPIVTKGTLDDDILRRDFTINSLFQTLDGRVFDRTGRGLYDLKRKKIVTVGLEDVTFSDDPLRMLRAIRFVSKYGFECDVDTIKGIKRNRERIHIISAERIRDEILQIVNGEHAREGLLLMQSTGLLHEVLPELEQQIGVIQNEHHIFDVWEHSLHAMENAPQIPFVRLLALLHDIGKPDTFQKIDGKVTFYNHDEKGAEMIGDILRRLRFSRKEIEQAEKVVKNHLRPLLYDRKIYTKDAIKRMVRIFGEERELIFMVAEADAKASAHPETRELSYLKEQMELIDKEPEIKNIKISLSPLTGDEICRICKRQDRGKWIGELKKLLEDAVLDGTIDMHDKAGAEKWITMHYNRSSSEMEL